MTRWQPITSGLFRFEDTCAVYALCDGQRAWLIDLGSGAALEHLAELGVATVAGIYFTHVHRDQCQGLELAQDAGIPLHFPAAARDLLDPSRRADFRKISPCDFAYPADFHPPHPVADPTCDLQHFQLHPLGPWDLQVFSAPGHAGHQVAFRVEGPGGLTLFCGDALHSAGQVHEAFCLETDHYTGAGARQAADTLCALRNLRPERLCPSHGPVTSGDVTAALDLTVARLRRLADLKDTIVPGRPPVRRLIRPHANTFLQLSEHLWVWNNSYLLVSDDGPLLLVDVPCILPPAFYRDLQATLGERPIEVALITHIHCDHVMGTADLKQRQPLACWAQERLVPGIERPYDLARPWLHNFPTRVDRALAEGQTVQWHEHALTAYWFPGQTDYHAAYALEVDGRRVLLAGDNFYPAQQWGGTGGQCGFNGGHPDRWRQSAELVLRLAPDWILASHLQPFEYRRADFEAVVAWSHEIAALMRLLAPDGNLERHHSPHLAFAQPYVQPASAACPVNLVLTNPYPHPLRYSVRPRLPAGVRGDTAVRAATVAPGGQATLAFQFDAAELRGMAMPTFDMTANDERWGEAVECYLRGPGDYLVGGQ